MTPAALLADLAARGVRLERHGEALHIVAPRGVLTETDKAALRAAKPGLLQLLGDRLATTTMIIACDCPPRRRGEVFVPCALHALCGSPPDPGAVAALDAEVRQAIAQYRVEIACGALGSEPLRVRGRPLADYLDLDTLGRLITTRVTLAEDAAGG